LTSQGRSIPQTKLNTKETQTYIDALSGIRAHQPSVWAGEDISCPTPRGHWDRLIFRYYWKDIFLVGRRHQVISCFLISGNELASTSDVFNSPHLWCQTQSGCKLSVMSLLVKNRSKVLYSICTEILSLLDTPHRQMG
jgi:hypothetical protein